MISPDEHAKQTTEDEEGNEEQSHASRIARIVPAIAAIKEAAEGERFDFPPARKTAACDRRRPANCPVPVKTGGSLHELRSAALVDFSCVGRTGKTL